MDCAALQIDQGRIFCPLLDLWLQSTEIAWVRMPSRNIQKSTYLCGFPYRSLAIEP